MNMPDAKATKEDLPKVFKTEGHARETGWFLEGPAAHELSRIKNLDEITRREEGIEKALKEIEKAKNTIVVLNDLIKVSAEKGLSKENK